MMMKMIQSIDHFYWPTMSFIRILLYYDIMIEVGLSFFKRRLAFTI